MAAARKHPEFTDQSVAQVAAKEQEYLIQTPVLFDAYQENTARVTPTSLVNFDRNRYSVEASCVGKVVTVRAYANRIALIHNGKQVGLHRRQYGRDKTLFEPWHYLDVLKQKPGALRNGTPFIDWDLPQALQKTREQLSRHPDGDRQFVGILAADPVHGLKAVEQACAEALAAKTVSRDLVLNYLSRANEEAPTSNCQTPAHLPKLRLLPQADCRRYDRLLSGGDHAS